MQLWSTALYILLTTQVEALLSTRGPFFHGGRKLPQPQVTLPSGATVFGWHLASPDGDVLAYTNLTYATLTSRFGVPHVYTAKAGDVINGTGINEVCIQPAKLAGLGGDPVEGVEDCLTLAIYIPPAATTRNRPVAVYIHGGFLLAGSATDSLGQLNYIALKSDAVVVSINYRLNLFGFLQPPVAEVVPANRGFRDQIAALQWVQQNIASFGGDPTRVTLWGQSAGARSVMALYQSPMTVGLFQRAIAMSPGYIPSYFETNLSTVKETVGARCMKATNCSTLQCLEQKDAYEFASDCNFYLHAEATASPDVVFAGYDGEVLLKPLSEALCNPWPLPNSNVPIILGGMSAEWRRFQTLIPDTAYLDRFYKDTLPPSWNKQQRSCLRSKTVQLFDGAPCPSNVTVCNLFTDLPLLQEATQVYTLGLGFSGSGTGAQYRYVMDIDALGGSFGSSHGGDLDLITGKSDVDPSVPKDKLENFRELFTGYLASFIQSGIPLDPTGTAAWTPVNPHAADKPVMQFNLSTADHAFMKPSVYFSNEAQEDLTKTLCGRQRTSCCAQFTC